MTVPARSYMTIGEVMACLRPDFPDVTISKIRFLEAAGLVEPARTPSGYRKFSGHDVERLRYILTAQRDQYLPLKVIRDQLDAIDRGALDPTGQAAAPRPRAVPPMAEDAPAPDPRLTRARLLEATGLEEHELRELESFGLLGARPGGYFDSDAVLVATTVARLRRHGLEPRHLRTVKAAADREIGLIDQVVTPLANRRAPDARARAEETTAELAELFVQLHAALVRRGIRDPRT